MARQIRLVVSYVLDWVVVLCFAVAGGVLNYISGFHRPFSLTDDALAYPLKSNIVSIPVVVIVSLAAPAIIIAALNAVSAVGSKAKMSKQSHGSRGRLSAVAWQTHAGWLGLCTALAVTLFVTSGLKDLIGKPRPDLLARCSPDLANIDKYIVGGFGMNLDSEAPPFVTSAICQQPDKRMLDDGFAAFPSGHSSFSSAGMVYLTLWLCARWSVSIPFMNPRSNRLSNAAAPPIWQVALAFTPIFVAMFICASRYTDFHHAGVDIIAGAIIGTVFAWASFRLYHLPMRRARGVLAWGPRSPQHAFWAHSQAEIRSSEEQGRRSMDTELRYLGPNHSPGTDVDHRMGTSSGNGEPENYVARESPV